VTLDTQLHQFTQCTLTQLLISNDGNLFVLPATRQPNGSRYFETSLGLSFSVLDLCHYTPLIGFDFDLVYLPYHHTRNNAILHSYDVRGDGEGIDSELVLGPLSRSLAMMTSRSFMT